MKRIKLDFSSWIALLSLLLSVPALAISTHQWWAQRELESAREVSTIYLKAITTEVRIREIRASLDLIRNNTGSYPELDDLYEDIDFCAVATDKIKSLFFSSKGSDNDTPNCVKSCALLDGLLYTIEDKYRQLAIRAGESHGDRNFRNETEK